MMRRFLDSLDRVAKFQSDDVIVLPGHGPQFSNLAERVAELKAHHGKRETAILEILRAGRSPHDRATKSPASCGPSCPAII